MALPTPQTSDTPQASAASPPVVIPRTYPTPPPSNSPSWDPVRIFISNFHASIFCAIPDAESQKSLPVIHSDVLDVDLQSRGYGLFYSVNGFKSHAKRVASNLLCLNAAFVDIDWPKERLGSPSPEDLATFKHDVLESLLSLSVESFLPTFIIETKNGYHAIWKLIDPIYPDNIDQERVPALFALYRSTILALIERFNGDPNATDAERVLRLPNTWHLKDPNRPFLTTLVHCEPSLTYRLKALHDFFSAPKLAADPDFKPAPLISVLMGDGWKSANGADEDLPPEAIEKLNREYPKCERPSILALMNKTGIGEGRRNQSLTIAVSAMREDGRSEVDCLAYFDHYNGLSAYEIASTIKSVFRRPTPYSYGWNHPLVAAGVTSEERVKVAGIISSYLSKEKRKRVKERALKADLPSPEKASDGNVTNVADPKTDKVEAAFDKATQEAIFMRLDQIIAERRPYLRYLVATNQFYEYEGGVYSPKSDEEMKALVMQEIIRMNLLPWKTGKCVNDKILALQSLPSIRVPRECTDPDVFNLRNGLYNIKTGEFHPHTPDIFFTSQLNVNYREDSISSLAPRWIRFVDEIMQGNAEKIDFLQQMAGYCFTRDTRFQKAFILFGSGANGKSTFLDVIAQILGDRNVSSLSLRDISTNFGAWSLYGKTLNVIEEISGNYFESDMIKKLITGAEIAADRKFKERKSFRSFAKFVFAVNQLPKIADTTTGLYRRFYIIDFNASFAGSAEIDLPQKLWAERDGIFLWCIAGLRKLLNQNGFKPPASIVDATEAFKEANSPLVEYLLSEYVPVNHGNRDMYAIPIESVFQGYQIYAKDHGYQAKNYQNFRREIENMNHRDLLGVHVTMIAAKRYVTGIMLKKPAPPINRLYPPLS